MKERGILMSTPMMALGLWQPWATAVAIGAKRIETRGQRMNHRGLLALYATLKTPQGEWDWAMSQPEIRQAMAKGGCSPYSLPRGKILCVVNVTDCRHTEHIRDSLTEQERVFGDYSDGRFAIFFDLVHRFEEPIPFKGGQGFRKWDCPVVIPGLRQP